MATFRMTLTLPGIPTMPTAGLEARIRQAFARNAGAMIVASVRNQLGQDAIYTLSPAYAARKPKMKGFRRVPGKSAGQPLILTGEGIFEALTWTLNGAVLEINVDDSKAMDDGFDYAEHFQEIADYLGKGLADVEDDLPDLLLDIVVAEMGL